MRRPIERLRARANDDQEGVFARLTGHPDAGLLATVALALAAAAAVWHVSTTVFPYYSLNHDEGVYLKQAAMLLEGRLSSYPPVEDVFLPWFFVEDGARIYPKYTPVPAAMFALGKLAGGYRLALPVIAAGNVALVVGVVREAFDRRTGLVAGVVVLCSPLFLVDSAVFLPYAPTTLLNLAFAYAYLRADRTGDRRWAAAAGAAVGLAFFSRQYTAVLFAAPFVCHALWTLRGSVRPALAERRLTPAAVRQAVTAAFGLCGVAVTLGYNAVMTGSPFLFPFHAFEPLDTVGFGERRLTGHTVNYTAERALEANADVLELFFTDWLAGGVVTAGLAAVGLAVAAWRGPDGRQAALAGVAGTVIVGNVFFWGNYNILGEVGNGLVRVLGTRYHFDLLVPTAAFAAVALVAGYDWLRDQGARLAARNEAADGGVERVGDGGSARRDRLVSVGVALVLVLALLPAGLATANEVDYRLDRNMDSTRTYERVYDAFDGGPPRNSVVFLPAPYGEWLNHPFQVLRNDPGYDGRAVYALDDRPFAVADAFPDRRLYRFVYRGVWAPYAGSPADARLQRVRDVRGDRVAFAATVGIPDRAVSVTARLGADGESRYRVFGADSDAARIRLVFENGSVRFAEGGDTGGASGGALPIDDREEVQLAVFVDYGALGGFSYRFDFPVADADERPRVLTPWVERCRGARTCGGAAAYVPDLAPDGVFVETNLTATPRESI